MTRCTTKNTSDELPLPTMTPPQRRPAHHHAIKRRSPSSSKALVYSLLLVATGAFLSFVETTRLLLQPNKADTIAHSVQRFTSEVVINSSAHVPVFDPLVDGDYSDYECVGWRQTTGCSPHGPHDPTLDKPCDGRVPSGASGYCEIRHRSNPHERRRVLPLHCESLHHEAAIECNTFADLLTYGRQALTYAHDRDSSFSKNQHELVTQNDVVSAPPDPSFFRRGITMVVYDDLVLSAYVSVRWLRELGCSLPVEIWYRRVETDVNHPLLKRLIKNHNVYLRELQHPLATGFYTKLHAVFYSAFDQVLLLDADNFAVKDPSYLFETPEFQTTGAMFWPDFWWPNHTTFNVHATSLVWQVFELPFVDMFEQESGQVLLDRRRHGKALDALMYYGFTLPRLHEEKRLVWGDKDLFRLAWLKSNSSFHFISRPPGSAGKMNETNGAFCGLTMVQHDANGEILFLHRNLEKLTEKNRPQLWTHVQQFKQEAPLSTYRIGWAKLFQDYESCWGKATDWEQHYTLAPMASAGLGTVEPTLLQFANEGVLAMNKTTVS
jgi:alpha 1,2-mannosyltransferase